MLKAGAAREVIRDTPIWHRLCAFCSGAEMTWVIVTPTLYPAPRVVPAVTVASRISIALEWNSAVE